jgi:hypothetical protein
VIEVVRVQAIGYRLLSETVAKEFPVYASRPKLPRLPMLKVDGMLAVAAAAFIPIIINMPRRPELDGTLLGYFILWFALWLPAIGFATIASVVRYLWLESKRQVAYPGLGTGLGYLAFFTLSLAVR